ncbi:zinc finger protein ZAT1 [Eutrema salsugineum]|nr:zinc finger protein ZAT1 [Eutrema salsugineum]
MYSLLKETKTCQVCKISFPNGRALGGHMRSHTQKLSASNAESATGSTIPSQQTSNKLGAKFRRPLETVLMRSVHTSTEVGACPKPDLKTEEGGQRQITGKRKVVVDLEDSSESDSCLTDEEGALCLVAMSEGKRPENCQKPKAIDRRLVSTQKGKEKYEHVANLLTSNVGTIAEDHDDDDDDDGGDVDDGDETYKVETEKKCKKKYKCDTCGKVLRSYQALGGHRTSHRNKRLKLCEKNDQAVKPENGLVVRRHYKCDICDRVFESGQALGGHKKVHYLFLKPSN